MKEYLLCVTKKWLYFIYHVHNKTLRRVHSPGFKDVINIWKASAMMTLTQLVCEKTLIISKVLTSSDNILHWFSSPYFSTGIFWSITPLICYFISWKCECKAWAIYIRKPSTLAALLYTICINSLWQQTYFICGKLRWCCGKS